MLLSFLGNLPRLNVLYHAGPNYNCSSSKLIALTNPSPRRYVTISAFVIPPENMSRAFSIHWRRLSLRECSLRLKTDMVVTAFWSVLFTGSISPSVENLKTPARLSEIGSYILSYLLMLRLYPAAAILLSFQSAPKRESLIAPTMLFQEKVNPGSKSFFM